MPRVHVWPASPSGKEEDDRGWRRWAGLVGRRLGEVSTHSSVFFLFFSVICLPIYK